MCRHMSEVLPGITKPDFNTVTDIMSTTPDVQFPLAIHFKMFMVQIKALATDQQIAYWKPKAENFEVLGCYAQTELAHGSDV